MGALLDGTAIADALMAGLVEAAEAIEREQAVRGLDAAEEVKLHPLLAAALARAGFGAHREERYPSDRARSRRSEGRRCDLVVTPSGRPLAPAPSPTGQLPLFVPADGCPLDEALWLEVKVVAQFVEGGAGNAGYAAALVGPTLRDVRKLATDEGIRRAALLLLLFTAEAETADHDLAAFAALVRRRGLPVGEPALRRVPIGDRFGNRLLTAALFPIGRDA